MVTYQNIFKVKEWEMSERAKSGLWGARLKIYHRNSRKIHLARWKEWAGASTQVDLMNGSIEVTHF